VLPDRDPPTAGMAAERARARDVGGAGWSKQGISTVSRGMRERRLAEITQNGTMAV
jgi:hypothetical protein